MDLRLRLAESDLGLVNQWTEISCVRGVDSALEAGRTYSYHCYS